MEDQTTIPQKHNTQNENKNNAIAKKKCKYWNRINHTTDKCYKLQRDVKNVERVKNYGKVDKADQSYIEGDCAHSSKN